MNRSQELMRAGERADVASGSWDQIATDMDGAEGPNRIERPTLISSSQWRHEPEIRYCSFQKATVGMR